VYKYADRGFGIRILPEYVRTLHPKLIHYWKLSSVRHWVKNCLEYTDHGYEVKPEYEIHARELPENLTAEEREKLHIIDGYKVLEKVQFFAYDMVERIYVGKTKRSVFDGPWLSNESTEGKKRVDMGMFDGRRQNCGNVPHGKQGLGWFELVMRHHAAWELEKKGLLEYTFLITYTFLQLPRPKR
jgi:hypothetical protein